MTWTFEIPWERTLVWAVGNSRLLLNYRFNNRYLLSLAVALVSIIAYSHKPYFDQQLHTVNRLLNNSILRGYTTEVHGGFFQSKNKVIHKYLTVISSLTMFANIDVLE